MEQIGLVVLKSTEPVLDTLQRVLSVNEARVICALFYFIYRSDRFRIISCDDEYWMYYGAHGLASEIGIKEDLLIFYLNNLHEKKAIVGKRFPELNGVWICVSFKGLEDLFAEAGYGRPDTYNLLRSPWKD